jgi:hypothetical protein
MSAGLTIIIIRFEDQSELKTVVGSDNTVVPRSLELKVLDKRVFGLF